MSEGGARIGVVVLDHDRPDLAERAARSVDVASRVLVVENGSSDPGRRGDRLGLAENLGFAGGMNAGIACLLAECCDRILLLNNDAELEPGCLARLAAAVADSRVAAAGPVILRSGDLEVESRGIRVSPSSGRVTLLGYGGVAPRSGTREVDALSGAVLMVSAAAYLRVGPFDESYFHSFEDVDWCLRARAAGLRLVVVHEARARHVGGATLGEASADRLYYAARNHVRVLDAREPVPRGLRWGRRAAVFGFNVAHAVTGPKGACRAVFAGVLDGLRGRGGRRRGA